MFQFVGASRAFTVSFTTLRGEHIVSPGKYDTRSIGNKVVKAVADPANTSIFFVIKLLIRTDSTVSNNTDCVLQRVTEIFDYYVNDSDSLFCILFS